MDRTELQLVIDSSRFTPTPAQVRRRAEMFSRGIQVSPDMLLEEVIALGVSGVVSRWWDIPGFREWFLSKDYNKHKAEGLLQQAMHRLSEVLTTSTDNAELINAAKEARTLFTALTTPTKGDEEKFADETIQEMSKEELQAYISKNTAGVNK